MEPYRGSESSCNPFLPFPFHPAISLFLFVSLFAFVRAIHRSGRNFSLQLFKRSEFQCSREHSRERISESIFRKSVFFFSFLFFLSLFAKQARSVESVKGGEEAQGSLGGSKHFGAAPGNSPRLSSSTGRTVKSQTEGRRIFAPPKIMPGNSPSDDNARQARLDCASEPVLERLNRDQLGKSQ